MGHPGLSVCLPSPHAAALSRASARRVQKGVHQHRPKCGLSFVLDLVITSETSVMFPTSLWLGVSCPLCAEGRGPDVVLRQYLACKCLAWPTQDFYTLSFESAAIFKPVAHSSRHSCCHTPASSMLTFLLWAFILHFGIPLQPLQSLVS